MMRARIAQRDRIVVNGALLALAVLAWAYLFSLEAEMPSGTMVGGVIAPMTMAWTGTDFVFMFIMWSVMMFAMMLPSITPTVMIFENVRAKREETGRTFVPTLAFVAGYLLIWVGFSFGATVINWWLHANGMLTSMMGNIAPTIGGILLVLAGIFQWTQLKDACLDHCRSPIGFLTTHWREGPTGAVLMGMHHGGYCLGCCWLLMGLLFVLGVMNLPWVAVLTIVVLSEKTLPFGRHVSRGLGAVLMVWGLWLIFSNV